MAQKTVRGEERARKGEMKGKKGDIWDVVASYAPTLHPCISETPNANLSFSPDSVFLVVTDEEKSGKKLSVHTINANSDGIDGNTMIRARGTRKAQCLIHTSICTPPVHLRPPGRREDRNRRKRILTR